MKKNSNLKENSYAKALKILGAVIMALGCLGSLVLGNELKIQHGVTYVYYEYNYFIMIAGVLSSVITGTLIMGMGELIRIAHETSVYTQLILKQTGYNGDFGIESIDEELPAL